jgi:hypothetical protein
MKTALGVMMLVALAGAACDNSNQDELGTSPTPIALTTVIFTGTVDPGGSSANNFVVARTGEIDVTLTAAGPPSTIFVGVGVGTPTATGCVLLSGGSVNTQAGSAPQLAGSAAAGTYCVAVFDVGNLVGPITYSVSVAHS